jgi:hypothetical protein
MNNSQKNIIRNWIREVTESGSWQEYNDLHIDMIDNKCENPSKWVKKGIEFLNEAIKIRNKMRLEYVIVLGIELSATKNHKEFSFKNLDDIDETLGNSPPSLYTFLPKWKNWQETIKKSVEIRNTIDSIKGLECSYYEYFSSHDKEFRRTLFLWSNP